MGVGVGVGVGAGESRAGARVGGWSEGEGFGEGVSTGVRVGVRVRVRVWVWMGARPRACSRHADAPDCLPAPAQASFSEAQAQGHVIFVPFQVRRSAHEQRPPKPRLRRGSPLMLGRLRASGQVHHHRRHGRRQVVLAPAVYGQALPTWLGLG